jgi:hypothetical protein
MLREEGVRPLPVISPSSAMTRTFLLFTQHGTQATTVVSLFISPVISLFISRNVAVDFPV